MQIFINSRQVFSTKAITDKIPTNQGHFHAWDVMSTPLVWVHYWFTDKIPTNQGHFHAWDVRSTPFIGLGLKSLN